MLLLCYVVRYEATEKVNDMERKRKECGPSSVIHQKLAYIDRVQSFHF